MLKYIFLVVFFLEVFASCKKETVQNVNKIVVSSLSTADYDAHFNEYYPHTNGDFNIWTECYVYFRPQLTHSIDLTVSGAFYNNATDSIPTNGGMVMVDTLHVPIIRQSYYFYKSDYDSNFYGKNITINVTPPIGQAPPFTAPIYMPKKIFAYMGRAALSEGNYVNNQSDTLYWNADPSNTNGVDIDAPIATNYNGQVVVGTKYIKRVPDNGMYVIPKSFYAAFAPGTVVTFIVGRRTYSLVTYNQYKYLLGAYCYTPIFSWEVP